MLWTFLCVLEFCTNFIECLFLYELIKICLGGDDVRVDPGFGYQLLISMFTNNQVCVTDSFLLPPNSTLLL